MTSRMWFKPLILSCLCAVICTGCFGRSKGGPGPGVTGGEDFLDIGGPGGVGIDAIRADGRDGSVL